MSRRETFEALAATLRCEPTAVIAVLDKPYLKTADTEALAALIEARLAMEDERA